MKITLRGLHRASVLVQGGQKRHCDRVRTTLTLPWSCRTRSAHGRGRRAACRQRGRCARVTCRRGARAAAAPAAALAAAAAFAAAAAAAAAAGAGAVGAAAAAGAAARCSSRCWTPWSGETPFEAGRATWSRRSESLRAPVEPQQPVAPCAPHQRCPGMQPRALQLTRICCRTCGGWDSAGITAHSRLSVICFRGRELSRFLAGTRVWLRRSA